MGDVLDFKLYTQAIDFQEVILWRHKFRLISCIFKGHCVLSMRDNVTGQCREGGDIRCTVIIGFAIRWRIISLQAIGSQTSSQTNRPTERSHGRDIPSPGSPAYHAATWPPRLWAGTGMDKAPWLLRTLFYIAPILKLVSMTWLLRGAEKIRIFTLSLHLHKTYIQADWLTYTEIHRYY
jgi:hypothetical protein